MADSETFICNLALAHLGDSKGIVSFTERSAAARACALWYAQTRDEVLRDGDWPFATRRGALALVEVFATGSEWGYSYRAPAGTLKVQRILPYGGLRIASSTNRVPFLFESDATGGLLYTDLPDAVVAYTIRVTDPQQYPPDFTAALALKLAAMMAPTVTAGDPQKLGNRALELYTYQLSVAKAAALNEQLRDAPADSEFIAGRD